MNPERADTSPVAELLPDPATRLAEGFRTIATTRMAGLPFLNPAIKVESVGFAPWDGRWLGVVVTPWFINLILAPQDPARWTSVAPGAKTSYAFPAGRYEFIGVYDELLGEYQMCSLFSPVNEIADHATAALIAGLAREALFDPEHATEEEGTPLTPEPMVDEHAPGLQEKIEAKLEQPMSKRGFLHGAFLKSPDEPRG